MRPSYGAPANLVFTTAGATALIRIAGASSTASSVVTRDNIALVAPVLACAGDGARPATDDNLKALATRKNSEELLFFTRTANGRSEAKAFVNRKRLKERTDNRDKAIAVRAFRKQLKAIQAWGLEQPADLADIQQPVLVANGDNDRMVPTINSYDLARRLPNATLRIYPAAGHGGIFQLARPSNSSDRQKREVRLRDCLRRAATRGVC